MKIAVMQPYFFPYIGYFELMASVDQFVFLNDVQYIRRGWVNRNKIPSANKNFQYLTVPVASHSRETEIKDIKVVAGWNPLHLAILRHTYGKKIEGKPLFEHYKSLGKYEQLQELLCRSLTWLAGYLEIKCSFFNSNGISNRKGKDRILDICHHFNADTYVNLSGGKHLYDTKSFGNIRLEFMEPTGFPNKNSIVDCVFKNHTEVVEWLAKFHG